MLERLEIALALNRRQKDLGISLDLDLVIEICELYQKSMFELYDKYNVYNLFEIIYILDKQAVDIQCELNKQSLVQMMVDQDIDITQAASGGINWKCHHIRHDDYCIHVLNMDNKVIANICEADIIRIGGDMFQIWEIQPYFQDDQDEFELYLTVTLFNSSTNEEEEYTAEEFMMFFEDEATTYVHNKIRSR